MSTTWDQAPERPQTPDRLAPVPPSPSEQPGAAEPRTGEAAWPAWTAPVGLLSGLMAAFVGGLIIAVMAAAFGAGDLDDTPPGVLLGGTIVQDIGFVAAAIILATVTAGRPWAAQFGLRPTRVWPAIGWMALLYVGFVVFTGLWQLLVEIDEDTNLLRDLGADRSALLLALSAVLVCVLAPLVEEFFFRGFFFRALFNWKGLWPAAIITGAVFGAIHLGSSPPGALVPLAVLGFGFCLLYWRTRSLYPCIAVHAINNAIAFGALNDWTWQIPLLVIGALVVSLGIARLAALRWRPPALAPLHRGTTSSG
jgi:membrane protease YdiL (CAAX protease family)